jgi:hypothetical protein
MLDDMRASSVDSISTVEAEQHFSGFG